MTIHNILALNAELYQLLSRYETTVYLAGGMACTDSDRYRQLCDEWQQLERELVTYLVANGLGRDP